jgi:hypothetical protein
MPQHHSFGSEEFALYSFYSSSSRQPSSAFPQRRSLQVFVLHDRVFSYPTVSSFTSYAMHPPAAQVTPPH